MFVAMCVGFAERIARRVLVLVVFVVKMKMFVLHHLMDVRVFVAFAHMEPDTREH
jgi:hypothetical protein